MSRRERSQWISSIPSQLPGRHPEKIQKFRNILKQREIQKIVQRGHIHKKCSIFQIPVHFELFIPKQKQGIEEVGEKGEKEVNKSMTISLVKMIMEVLGWQVSNGNSRNFQKKQISLISAIKKIIWKKNFRISEPNISNFDSKLKILN